ncbi:MAG: hypothetical protein NVS9B15_24500 [Acidobacteriaceae bacterium]
MKGVTLRRASAAALSFATILLASCGDTYRPVANPIPQQGGPQPASPAYALVVSNTGAGTQGVLSSINLPGDQSMGQIAVGVDASFAMTPDGTRGLVTGRGDDTLTVVSPVTTPLVAFTRTVTLQPNSSPSFVTSDGATAWVANPGRNGKAPTLGVVSLSTFTETTEVPVGANPTSVLLNSVFSQVNVVNNGSDSVTVVSSRDNSVLATVAVGSRPVSAVTGTNGLVYVINSGSGSISQINPNTDTVTATLSVGTNPVAVAFDPSVRKLVVANKGSNNVSLVDVDPSSLTYLQVTNVTVGVAPVAVAVLPGSHRAIVANSGSNDVTVVDTLSNRVIVASVPVGPSPVSVSSSPDGSKAIVANSGASTVTLVETTHYTTTATISVPPQPILTANTP